MRRLLSVIQHQRVARRILEHLGLPAMAPPRGQPWRAAGQEHARPIPIEVACAAEGEFDLDRRILKMLAARAAQRHMSDIARASGGDLVGTARADGGAEFTLSLPRSSLMPV